MLKQDRQRETLVVVDVLPYLASGNLVAAASRVTGSICRVFLRRDEHALGVRAWMIMSFVRGDECKRVLVIESICSIPKSYRYILEVSRHVSPLFQPIHIMLPHTFRVLVYLLSVLRYVTTGEQSKLFILLRDLLLRNDLPVWMSWLF